MRLSAADRRSCSSALPDDDVMPMTMRQQLSPGPSRAGSVEKGSSFFMRGNALSSSFGRFLAERQRAAAAISSALGLSSGGRRPSSADFTLLFSGNYWSCWGIGSTEKLPLQPPFSLVRAILTVPTNTVSQQQSIIVLFSEGEIMAFSPVDNWTSVEWRCKVAAPSDLPKPIEHFKIFHGAYDSVTDNIFFTVEDDGYNQPYIFRAGRRQLQRPNDNRGFVRLGHFIATLWGIFGISVDSKRRLLFACEYVANCISIWRISQDKSPRLTAKINCITWPCFVAPFFDSDNADDEEPKAPQVKIAVSRTSNNEVVVLQAKLAQFTERILKTKQDPSNNCIDDVFTDRHHQYDVDIIATESQVSSPEEVIFDRQGNLFVADGRNNRIQIFSNLPGEMKVVWASENCTNFGRRVALIGKHPQTGRPAALVGKGNLVEWYY